MKTKEQLRQEFERVFSQPPYEWALKRFPDDPSKYAWPKNYTEYFEQVAWDAWVEACIYNGVIDRRDAF